MGNEATKKDLADLEKRVNTKLQNLVDTANKAIESLEKRQNDKLQALVDSTNKAMVAETKSLNDLVAVVNQHAKIITGLQKQ